MGAFYQLAEFDYQNECRLLVNRPQKEALFHTEAELAAAFPFEVYRDEEQDCNYIDCDLIQPTCIPFQIRLTAVMAGSKRPTDQVASVIDSNWKHSDLVVSQEDSSTADGTTRNFSPSLDSETPT